MHPYAQASASIRCLVNRSAALGQPLDRYRGGQIPAEHALPLPAGFTCRRPAQIIRLQRAPCSRGDHGPAGPVARAARRMCEGGRWCSRPGVLAWERRVQADDEDSGVQADGQRAGGACAGECRIVCRPCRRPGAGLRGPIAAPSGRRRRRRGRVLRPASCTPHSPSRRGRAGRPVPPGLRGGPRGTVGGRPAAVPVGGPGPVQCLGHGEYRRALARGTGRRPGRQAESTTRKWLTLWPRRGKLAGVHPAGLTSFQCPSEMTSTLPPVTLMAV